MVNRTVIHVALKNIESLAGSLISNAKELRKQAENSNSRLCQQAVGDLRRNLIDIEANLKHLK
tara:strand:+ start:366 stop:554 length:189 start_codon:yes stop_codon:yes gene_type:complete